MPALGAWERLGGAQLALCAAWELLCALATCISRRRRTPASGHGGGVASQSHAGQQLLHVVPTATLLALALARGAVGTHLGGTAGGWVVPGLGPWERLCGTQLALCAAWELLCALAKARPQPAPKAHGIVSARPEESGRSREDTNAIGKVSVSRVVTRAVAKASQRQDQRRARANHTRMRIRQQRMWLALQLVPVLAPECGGVGSSLSAAAGAWAVPALGPWERLCGTQLLLCAAWELLCALAVCRVKHPGVRMELLPCVPTALHILVVAYRSAGSSLSAAAGAGAVSALGPWERLCGAQLALCAAWELLCAIVAGSTAQTSASSPAAWRSDSSARPSHEPRDAKAEDEKASTAIAKALARRVVNRAVARDARQHRYLHTQRGSGTVASKLQFVPTVLQLVPVLAPEFAPDSWLEAAAGAGAVPALGPWERLCGTQLVLCAAWELLCALAGRSCHACRNLHNKC